MSACRTSRPHSFTRCSESRPLGCSTGPGSCLRRRHGSQRVLEGAACITATAAEAAGILRVPSAAPENPDAAAAVEAAGFPCEPASTSEGPGCGAAAEAAGPLCEPTSAGEEPLEAASHPRDRAPAEPEAVPCDEDSIHIVVRKAISGDWLAEVSLRPTDTVLDLAREVYRAAGARVRLFCGTKRLDDSRTLLSEDICDRSEVLAVYHTAFVVTGSEDHTARLWDAYTGQCLQSFEGHEGTVESVHFTPDGSTLCTGSVDGFTKLWDMATGECWRTMQGRRDPCGPSSTSPDGKLTATSLCQRVQISDAKTYSVIRVLQTRDGGRAVPSWSPDGSMLAFATADGCAEVWDVETGELVRVLGGHAGHVKCARFAP